jgi:hypothetical protein
MEGAPLVEEDQLGRGAAAITDANADDQFLAGSDPVRPRRWLAWS